MRADGDVVVIEGGDVSGVDDIGFVNAEKQAGGKLFLHGLESHFGNDPLIFQLENHVIFQSLDKKNILEIYLEITSYLLVKYGASPHVISILSKSI